MARRVSWIRVCFLVHLSGSFLGIGSLVFSETLISVRIQYEDICDSRIFLIFFLPPKWGKWAKNSFFFNLLKNFVTDFSRIWSVMRVYIIFYIPAQIPSLGKIWFLRCGPKFYRPIFRSTLSLEQNDEKAWFFACWYNSWKLKADWKILRWVWPLWSQDSKTGFITRKN